MVTAGHWPLLLRFGLGVPKLRPLYSDHRLVVTVLGSALGSTTPILRLFTYQSLIDQVPVLPKSLTANMDEVAPEYDVVVLGTGQVAHLSSRHRVLIEY